VYADDKFSMSLAEGARRWAPEYGLQLSFFQKVAKGAPDLDRIATAARETGAQALLMAGHFDDAINMRRAISHIGWPISAYYASIGPGLDAYRTMLGGDAEGTFTTSVWEPREDLKLPGSEDFLRGFVGLYREQPSYQAAQAYAAGQILERAVQRAGRLDRAAVHDALAQLDTNVLIGRFVVDRTGSQTKRFPMIVQWQHGRREIVFPPEIRTAQPVLAK